MEAANCTFVPLICSPMDVILPLIESALLAWIKTVPSESIVPPEYVWRSNFDSATLLLDPIPICTLIALSMALSVALFIFPLFSSKRLRFFNKTSCLALSSANLVVSVSGVLTISVLTRSNCELIVLIWPL